MNNIVCKVAALGGTISTTDISHLSEYKRLLRAKERGDLIKLRHGIYAVPDALLNTMIDVERIVPNGIVSVSYTHLLTHKMLNKKVKGEGLKTLFYIYARQGKKSVFSFFWLSGLDVYKRQAFS